MNIFLQKLVAFAFFTYNTKMQQIDKPLFYALYLQIYFIFEKSHIIEDMR
jgi:hypothetical protein